MLPYTLWGHVFASLMYACVYALWLYCIANILLNALLFSLPSTLLIVIASSLWQIWKFFKDRNSKNTLKLSSVVACSGRQLGYKILLMNSINSISKVVILFSILFLVDSYSGYYSPFPFCSQLFPFDLNACFPLNKKSWQLFKSQNCSAFSFLR